MIRRLPTIQQLGEEIRHLGAAAPPAAGTVRATQRTGVAHEKVPLRPHEDRPRPLPGRDQLRSMRLPAIPLALAPLEAPMSQHDPAASASAAGARRTREAAPADTRGVPGRARPRGAQRLRQARPTERQGRAMMSSGRSSIPQKDKALAVRAEVDGLCSRVDVWPPAPPQPDKDPPRRSLSSTPNTWTLRPSATWSTSRASMMSRSRSRTARWCCDDASRWKQHSGRGSGLCPRSCPKPDSARTARRATGGSGPADRIRHATAVRDGRVRPDRQRRRGR